MAKCSLCGGTLDANKRCTLCGLDNTKNDEQYKHMLNRSDCEGQALTHVHEHKQSKTANAKEKYTKAWTVGMPQTKTSSSTSSKKNDSQKNIVSVIGIIVALLGVFSTLFGFVEDVFYEEVHVEATYETYLEPGSYTVGTHIPEGTYTMEIDTGEWGLVEIMEGTDGELFMEKCFYLSIDDEDRIEDIYLGENHVLNIPTGITLYVYSLDADSEDMTSQLNSQTEGYLISQTSVAGVDFPAGVYDIVFDLEYPDDSGTVSYQIMNPQTGLVMMERSQIIDSDNAVFRNLTLTEGSVIWVEGLQQVIIQPSEVISVTE